MTFDETANPREALWQQLEYHAREEAEKGDGRSLRAVQHLREVIEGRKPARQVYPDDGN